LQDPNLPQTQSRNIYANLDGRFEEGQYLLVCVSQATHGFSTVSTTIPNRPSSRSKPWFSRSTSFQMRRTKRKAGGEYNAHLTERWGNAVPQQRRNPEFPDDSIPESVPSKANEDVRKYYELARKPVAGAGPWLDKPEIPHPNEILRHEPASGTIETLITTGEEPRPKKIDGPYENTEDYLSTEYELLREDALRPLRDAVAEVRKYPWKDEAQYENSVGIYEPVYLTSLVFSPRGLATRVTFSMSRVKKHIRYVRSRR
jgi:helicase required for RNAi-mediated heterochromatin assembly 1